MAIGPKQKVKPEEEKTEEKCTDPFFIFEDE